jgi:uncharacterized LabA/DUF88 family protein
MSKNVAVFVDVANLYYAARGQDVDVDYVALLKHATKGRDLIRAYAYSGLDPENENQKKFLDFLSKNGYRVVAKDIRKFGDGRVKANLDIELVVDLFRLADRMDVAVIVSGDGDFAPAIRALQDVGVRCEVASFKPNTSSDLFAVADEFHDVMKISAIGRQKDTKGVGAPEMPAKEVNPDVGFREASPSVAAAALAAARSDGDDSGRGRGTSRGSSRRSDRPTRTGRSSRSGAAVATDGGAASEAAPAETVAASGSDSHDETASDAARRRRRRGGRGRGRRGRRGTEPELGSESSDGEPAKISWQEVDSLEELDGIQAGGSSTGGEFGFEEADAATLAELGLTEQPTAAPAVTTPETPAPKPRTRRAPAKAAATASATSSRRTKAASTDAPAKATRSRSTSKTAAKDAGATDSAAAATPTPKKAARKSRPTKAAAAAQPAAEAGSDEGIWKRFTSGRTTKTRTPEPPAEA